METGDQNIDQILSPAARLDAGDQLDCWNKIGVMGDGSCGELAQVVHCRNCPVFSVVGARLLDRAPPPDYRRDWAEHFARAKTEAAAAKISVVVFRLAAEWLALPTSVFQEIIEGRVIHSLPNRRNGVVIGLINLRGELQICVSLEKLLGIQTAAPADTSSISTRRHLLVTQWQGNVLVFPVDEIHGIHRYLSDELKNVPATVANGRAPFTRGILTWQNRPVGCLDEDVLFSTLNRSLA